MKNLLLILFTTVSQITYTQKVDIDNYRVEFEVINFPERFIETEKRTYSVEVTGDKEITSVIDPKTIKLFGYTQVESKGVVKIEIDAGRLFLGSATMTSRIQENKDKNGKILSRTSYYTYNSTNSAEATLTIYGPMSTKDLENEREKEEKKNSKKEKKVENQFLKAASNNTSTASNTDSDNPDYKKVDTKYINPVYSYYGSESTNVTAALRSYNAGVASAYDNHLKAYPKDVISTTQKKVNDMYGYFPIRLSYQKMKILDSEDHPEYNTFQQATEAAKVLFKNLKYNSDISTFRADFAPILDYFSGLNKKLDYRDKQEKKLKGAALYNIAMINCTLDNFDAAIAACNEMIRIDQDKGDAEDLLEKIAEIKVDMDKHKMVTRHIPGF